MTHAAASPNRDSQTILPTADVSAGEILIDLAAELGASSDAQLPTVIKVTPRGKTQTRDNRAYDFKPEVLVARFDADGVDLPIDIEHSLTSFLRDGQAGAVGWIGKLEARSDGLYAHVDWLQPAIDALKARTHRYVSPTFRHDEFGQPTWLHSVALVAAPALPLPALASAQLTETPTMPLAKLAAVLGLTANANEDEMVAALEARLSGSVEKAVHDAALAKLTAATEELDTLKAGVRADKLSALMEGALKDKKITPAEREHYEKLAATEEGFAQVEALFAAMPAKLGASPIEGQDPPDNLATLTAEDREVMAMMGQTEDEYRAANGLKAG